MAPGVKSNFQKDCVNSPLTIFFDVGNTLLFPGAGIFAPLHERKLTPSRDLWHSIERRTKREFDSAMRDGANPVFWQIFYTHLLQELDAQDDPLREALVNATHLSANWNHIVPGTREILERLGQRFQLAVISNADGKVAGVLERSGIADCFIAVTDSGVVGCEKPHPAIFETALEGLGVAPDRSLYVGDILSVDYLGATGAGMQSVLLDVCGAYRESELPRVQSLEELEYGIEMLTK